MGRAPEPGRIFPLGGGGTLVLKHSVDLRYFQGPRERWLRTQQRPETQPSPTCPQPRRTTGAKGQSGAQNHTVMATRASTSSGTWTPTPAQSSHRPQARRTGPTQAGRLEAEVLAPAVRQVPHVCQLGHEGLPSPDGTGFRVNSPASILHRGGTPQRSPP